MYSIAKRPSINVKNNKRSCVVSIFCTDRDAGIGEKLDIVIFEGDSPRLYFGCDTFNAGQELKRSHFYFKAGQGPRYDYISYFWIGKKFNAGIYEAFNFLYSKLAPIENKTDKEIVTDAAGQRNIIVVRSDLDSNIYLTFIPIGVASEGKNSVWVNPDLGHNKLSYEDVKLFFGQLEAIASENYDEELDKFNCEMGNYQSVKSLKL